MIIRTTLTLLNVFESHQDNCTPACLNKKLNITPDHWELTKWSYKFH